MKLVSAVIIILLVGCASTSSPSTPDLHAAFVGNWFSGKSLNRTDYRLDDCRYTKDGAFSCTLEDHGCTAHGFCEVISEKYSGTWSIQGTVLTREIQWGSNDSTHSRDTWTIKQLSGDILFVDEAQWFRKASARNKYVLRTL